MTIQELAKLANVSVRTLHYYDEIGLLKPKRGEENKYRIYEQDEISRLQQILFFRELDFSLEKIKEIMSSPHFDQLTALHDQKSLLELKRIRIEKLLQSIDKTIDSLKGGETLMNNDDTFSAFNDPTYQQHKEEAEQRWGKTDAYKQSMERVGKMSRDDLEKIKLESDDITNKMATLMQSGTEVTSGEVQEQVARHFKIISHFYDPSPAMYRGLGQMYIQDPRFASNYEKVASGLAEYFSRAMSVFADGMHK